MPYTKQYTLACYNGIDNSLANAIRLLKQPISQPYNGIDNGLAISIDNGLAISQPYNGIDNGLGLAISIDNGLGLANAISRLITGSIDSGSVIFDNIHF